MCIVDTWWPERLAGPNADNDLADHGAYMTPIEADGSPVFTVTKKGRLLELSRDPHPESDRYMAIEAPGMLVLFAKEGNSPFLAENEAAAPAGHPQHEPDRDAQLRLAFAALSGGP